MDAFGAGVRLIPFNLLIALGAIAVNIVAGKPAIPPIVLLSVGVTLQLTGVCLLSTMTSVTSIPSAIYAYQILTGLGIGIMFGLCLVLPPAVAKSKDLGEWSAYCDVDPRTNKLNSPLRGRCPAIPCIRWGFGVSCCVYSLEQLCYDPPPASATT